MQIRPHVGLDLNPQTTLCWCSSSNACLVLCESPVQTEAVSLGKNRRIRGFQEACKSYFEICVECMCVQSASLELLDKSNFKAIAENSSISINKEATRDGSQSNLQSFCYTGRHNYTKFMAIYFSVVYQKVGSLSSDRMAEGSPCLSVMMNQRTWLKSCRLTNLSTKTILLCRYATPVQQSLEVGASGLCLKRTFYALFVV